MTAIIKAKGLRKYYGDTHALDGVDLEIQPGRIVGLIGPNGAGKTTALKAILGLTSFQGELSVLGLDPRKDRPELMKQVCFIADVATLPRWATVAQLLEFVEQVHPNFHRDRALEFLSKTKVRLDKKIRELSKGMIVQTHLAIVMSIDATLLVLDEPTLGLDILYRKEFYHNLLTDYFDESRTILVTTHQVEEVEKILSDVLFIQDGKIVLDESMENLAARFVEVMVSRDKAEQARKLGPITEREVFGRHVFLFEGLRKEELNGLGEYHVPSVADLFVAKMREGAQA